MGRALKDETQGIEGMEGIETVSPEEPMPETSPYQIQVSEALEKTLVQIIREDYQSFKDHRDSKNYGKTEKGETLNFEKWYKGLMDLYNSQREPKTVPWKFCSNRSLRIAAAIVDMLHARIFPAVVHEDLLRWRPGEATDVPKVERISKLMHWWVWVNSRLREFFDNWVKVCIAFGDVWTETRWEVDLIDTGRTVTKPITDEAGNQLVNPDGSPAVTSFRDIKRKERSSTKIYMKDQVFTQKGSRNLEREPVIFEEEFLYRDLEQGEAEGKFVNVSNLLKNMLPVSETAGLAPSEAERVRELKIRNYPVKVLKWYGSFDADGDGFPEEVRVLISPEFDIYLGGVAVHTLTKTGRRPIDVTKFASRLDRPEETEGEGILEKIRELALEIDAIFNQMTDSNTLSILRPGFYDPAGDIDAPVLQIAPNKITPITAPNQNMYFPDFTVRTEQLIVAIRLVLEFIERLTAASSYVLGKESEIVGGSGTATRTNAIVSSAEQRFAIPAERLREGASRIIRQHLDMLQLNIPPGLESRILGEDGTPVFETNELTQEGIAGEFDAYLLADPSMGSKATERELASMFYSILLQNVIVGTDPVKIYKVTADLLKAYGKDPVEYLGPEPVSDNIDDPADENTLIIQGDFQRVRAQITENHILHIKAHSDLLQSPTLAQIPPHLLAEITQFTQQHIMEHERLMAAMMQLMANMGGKVGESGNSRGGPKASEGAPVGAGMENIQGPLGAAMDEKRKGESSGPQGQ